MKAGQRDLGGPGQPRIVIGKRIGFVGVAGELPLIQKRLLAGDRRHRDRGEARLGNLLKCPAHQLGLEQCQSPL